MEIGIDADKDTLQSLIRSCLLELNKLKYDLTELEVERANDNTPQRIKELEKDIVDKEKEVSVIKFKAEDEINLLKKQLEEKDILIKNQEDRIYELDYVNNSLDEIKEYFAEQLRDYKKKELSEVNERLNESYKSIAEKEAQINTLSRTIDDYKIKVIKLENDVESQTQIKREKFLFTPSLIQGRFSMSQVFKYLLDSGRPFSVICRYCSDSNKCLRSDSF